jgi:hypothetical protein
MGVCAACGREDRIWKNRRCFACNLADRLDTLLAGPGGAVPHELAGLRDALSRADPPRAVLRWIAGPTVATVLGKLARGEMALTHESLDQFGTGRSIGHLRQVLVTVGVLPERNEMLAGLEIWTDRQLAAIADSDDRHVIAAFASWWVLRRRRARAVRRPASSVERDHHSVARAMDLLAWLRAHDRPLAACTQADIDLWLAAGPPSRRLAQGFVRWARRHKMCGNIDIARRPDSLPVATADVTDLAAIARRLLNDSTIPLRDRVAGLLVILYGQPIARIVELDVERIGGEPDQGTTTLLFGATPVELPEPLGRLVRQLAATPTSRAALADPDSRWLFPGGRPGRPVTPKSLQLRLNKLGVQARPARTTMLLELAGELAPAVIADMLGLNPGTAVRWARAAAGDWNAYAAHRAQTS